MNIQELGIYSQGKYRRQDSHTEHGFLGNGKEVAEVVLSKEIMSPRLCTARIRQGRRGLPDSGVERHAQRGCSSRQFKKPWKSMGPFLLNIIVEPEENVYPMVPAGASLSEIVEEPVVQKKAGCK
jgi:acetolactate synthase-1/2/3 large subunit